MRGFAVLIFVSACGNRVESAPDAGTPRPDTSIAPSDAASNENEKIVAACAAQASARCRDIATCAGATERYASEADCRAQVALHCSLRATLPGVVEPVRTIEACTAALEKAGCDPERRSWALRRSCGGWPGFRGSLPTGAPCVAHEQCATGACQVPAGGCGTCIDVALLGESCATKGCWSGLAPRWICDLSSNLCVFRYAIAVGDACGPGVADCVDGLDCRDGRCALGVGKRGDACGPGAACGRGMFCLDDICHDVAFVGPGEVCDGAGGPTSLTYHMCRADAYCPPTGKCLAKLTLGARCDDVVGPFPCASDLTCAPADPIRTCQRTADICR